MKVFRIVAFVEGITCVLLFCIAMPLKYGFGNPVLVPPVGLIHGYAFLAYIAVMLFTLPGKGFSLSGWIRTTLAGFVPFGTFLNAPYIRRHGASRIEG